MKRTLLTMAVVACSVAPLSRPVFAQTTTTAPAVSAAPLPNGVVADVNGEKIMMADFKRMVDAYVADEPSLNTGSPEALKALSTIRGQILDNLIDARLLTQEARRQKITVKDEDVNKAIESMKGQFKSPDEFTKSLAKDGKTEADVKRVLTEDMILRELSNRLTADVIVSNDDIAEYYRANLAKFNVPEGVRARHILLTVNPKAPADQKAIVLKRAQELLKKAKAGSDFAALAKTNSDDPGSKEDGGDLGVFTRGQMVKPFEEAAFGAAKGAIVGPVETDFGYHIIKVEDKIPAHPVPLKEVQENPEMKQFILYRKVRDRLDEKVAALKKTAKINKANV